MKELRSLLGDGKAPAESCEPQFAAFRVGESLAVQRFFTARLFRLELARSQLVDRLSKQIRSSFVRQ